MPSLLAQGALMLLVGLGAWVLAGAAATPLAVTLASVAVLLVTIAIVLFYRRTAARTRRGAERSGAL